MKSLFEFPEELEEGLGELIERYFGDFSEASFDKYVRGHASK